MEKTRRCDRTCGPLRPKPVPWWGPLYGGAIIEWIGWRWIFWLDVPQSLLLIALLAILPNRANPAAKMDYLGAFALVVALTMLTFALAQRGIFTGESLTPYLTLAVAVVLVGTLFVVERRAIQPLLAPFLYTSRAFVSSNITQFSGGYRVDHDVGMRTSHDRNRPAEGDVGERPKTSYVSRPPFPLGRWQVATFFAGWA